MSWQQYFKKISLNYKFTKAIFFCNFCRPVLCRPYIQWRSSRSASQSNRGCKLATIPVRFRHDFAEVSNMFETSCNLAAIFWEMLSEIAQKSPLHLHSTKSSAANRWKDCAVSTEVRTSVCATQQNPLRYSVRFLSAKTFLDHSLSKS